jgi:hypothetical protein
MTLTRSLLTAAVIATLADAVSFVAFVLPGHAAERNPLIASLDPSASLAARAAALVLIGALAVAADRIDRRLLTAVVRVALGAAIVGGCIGAAATVAAL